MDTKSDTTKLEETPVPIPTTDHDTAPAETSSASATSTSTTAATSSDKAAQYYSQLTSRLPPAISSRLPTNEQAATSLSSLQTRLEDLSTTSSKGLTELHRSGTVKFGELRKKGLKGVGTVGTALDPEQLCKNAYSISNSTQIALNVSLNQVGPLMYQVLLPNEVFERRVPGLWFAIEVRPYPEAPYTPWSVSWPILAVSGPVVAATSLLAIPFVALAVGGSALASLTGFGSAVATGATATAATLTSTAASTASLAAKATHLPYGKKIKSRLVDAAKTNLAGPGQEAVKQQVVRYLSKGAATAAFGGAALGATGEGKEAKAKTEEELGAEWEKRKAELKEKRKVDEVDVTGFELEKVLKCETGSKKVDKALADAFKKLSFKAKNFKTKDNPVLKIVGGPELEVRGTKSFLIFYPFSLQTIVDIAVEPISPSEVPPTEDEEVLLRDARVVDSTEEAEAVVEGTGTHAEEKVKVDGAAPAVVAGEKEKKGWFGTSWGK